MKTDHLLIGVQNASDCASYCRTWHNNNRIVGGLRTLWEHILRCTNPNQIQCLQKLCIAPKYDLVFMTLGLLIWEAFYFTGN